MTLKTDLWKAITTKTETEISTSDIVTGFFSTTEIDIICDRIAKIIINRETILKKRLIKEIPDAKKDIERIFKDYE